MNRRHTTGPLSVRGLMLDAARLVESLGHSHCITKTAEHADINDQGPDGHTWANALIPMHPKTLRILGDLRIDLY